MSKKAKAAFLDFYNDNINFVEQSIPAIQAICGKLEAYCARIALLIQLCQNPDSVEVEEDAVNRAIVITHYFRTHAIKVYHDLDESTKQDRHERALRYFPKKQQQYQAN